MSAPQDIFAEDRRMRRDAIEGSDKLRLAVERLMEKQAEPKPKRVLKAKAPIVRELVAIAADSVGVTTEELLGPRRFKWLAQARWAVMLTLRDVRGWSLPHIGYHMRGLDHTTVLNGCRRAVELRANNPAYDRLCKRLAEVAA